MKTKTSLAEYFQKELDKPHLPITIYQTVETKAKIDKILSDYGLSTNIDWQPVTPESYDGKSNLTRVSTEEIEKNRCKAYKRIL